MKTVVPLVKAREEELFGAKAVGLGDALRGGLPVPPGIALAGSIVEEVASGDDRAVKTVAEAVRALPVPLAVRSSAVGEDSDKASFAGQHLTVLNVPTPEGVGPAVKEIWWSANSDSAITYRQRVGLFTRPSVGVVVQTLVNPDVAGVMFTKHPITQADERVIEAAWGLGEAVVAGRVIPDQFRVSTSGEVLERTAGMKKIAIRSTPEGGTVDERLAPELVEQLCLGDQQLKELSDLAGLCERVYGPARDIEFAFADGKLYLLQCRAVTSATSKNLASAVVGAPIEVLERVPLFSDLDKGELEQIARLFKERRFSEGETVAREGTGGATFFVIESGEATVAVRGKELAKLAPGDFFGEIALIDEGARSATITANGDLACYGLTLWDFKPVVQKNPTIGWKLLQSLAKKLREAQGEQ